MKIYDTHADIFHNLYERYINGEKDVFEKYHLSNLNASNVVGGIWVIYGDSDFDVHNAYDIALKEFDKYKNDFDVIYGLEGLRNVKDVEALDKLYQKGIRHASLTWNEANHFATGVAGEATRGLQKEGIEVLEYMNSHDMVVDVSHLNIKSFYDVLEQNPKILMASHSNAYGLTEHRRNLNDDQLKCLKELNGYVGVNSARNFVSKDPTKQNINGLVDHMIYLAEHIGIDYVMLGLDMMDFLHEFPNANLDDLQTHKDASRIIDVMRLRGFKDSDIEKISYKNYLKAIKNIKR